MLSCGAYPCAAAQAGRRQRRRHSKRNDARREGPPVSGHQSQKRRRARRRRLHQKHRPRSRRHDLPRRASGHTAYRAGRRPCRAEDIAPPRGRRAHVLLHGLPHRHAALVDMGRRCRTPRGCGHRRRGARVRRRRASGAGHQSATQPAMRPQLRVLLRGPAAVGSDGSRIYRRGAERRSSTSPSTIRRSTVWPTTHASRNAPCASCICATSNMPSAARRRGP